MQGLLGQIIVILLLVVVIVVALVVFGVIKPDSMSIPSRFSGRKDGRAPIPKDENATKRMPKWKVELINNEDGRVLKETVIPGLKGNERFVIGRTDCDFVIPSEYISRHNAEIGLDGSRYILRARKIGTEIYHNGKLCEQIVIRDGLVLKFAKVIPIRFVEVSSEDLINDALSDEFEMDDVQQEETFHKEVINPRF